MTNALPPLARRLLMALVLCQLLLVAAHLSRFTPVSLPLAHLFNLDTEETVPAWFSSLQLAAIGAVAAALYSLENRSARHRWIWLVLAGTFCFLSADESVQIHEIFDRRTDLFAHKWCYYYAPPAAAIAIACAVFLRARLDRSRGFFRLFCMGSATLVSGAIGMEMVDYCLVGFGVEDRFWYRLEVVVEELLEMLGASVILCTLVAQASVLVRERTRALVHSSVVAREAYRYRPAAQGVDEAIDVLEEVR